MKQQIFDYRKLLLFSLLIIFVSLASAVSFSFVDAAQCYFDDFDGSQLSNDWSVNLIKPEAVEYTVQNSQVQISLDKTESNKDLTQISLLNNEVDITGDFEISLGFSDFQRTGIN